MKKTNNCNNPLFACFEIINDFQNIKNDNSNLLDLRNRIKYLEFEVIKLSACVDRPEPDLILLDSKISDLKKQVEELFNSVEHF